MDPSIADILASVTRAHHETNSSTENGALLSDTAQQQSDLQHLTRAWVSERVGPELLPYPADLMDRVMRRIREQIETIEDRTARMDAGTSFSLVVIQTELERFKFLVRSYLRARIAKIDAHSLHILSVHQSQQQQDGTPPLLSPQELQYLTTHAALLERHYNSSFLSSFPPKLRRLDDRAGTGGVGVIEGPDLDKAVFVRCLGVPNNAFGSRNGRRQLYDFDEEMQEDGDAENDAGFGPVEVSCGFTIGPNEGQDGMDDAPSSSRPRDTPRLAAERTIHMRRGDVWMVRWSSVREAVARGECELI